MAAWILLASYVPMKQTSYATVALSEAGMGAFCILMYVSMKQTSYATIARFLRLTWVLSVY